MIVIRGLVLFAMIIGFLGIWAWAWSKQRKPMFEEAARLPLEEDVVRVAARAEKEE